MKRVPALILAVLVLMALGAPRAETDSRWAPAATAKIHPGVQMFTQGAQCTANFVFTDAAHRVYVGYAAHCAGLGGATDTNGCTTGSVPLGTRVRLAKGATAASNGTTLGYGRLAYSSWKTMHRLHEKGADACAYNDLALVRLSATAAQSVNPSVPFWGGPTGIDTNGTPLNTAVFSYGNSSLRGGVDQLGPKTGVSLGPSGHGWSTDVFTVSPGIPGDSGSGFMDDQGRAIGVLSTLALTPVPGVNGVGDLYHAYRYAKAHSGITGLRLVPGTEKFDPVL